MKWYLVKNLKENLFYLILFCLLIQIVCWQTIDYKRSPLNIKYFECDIWQWLKFIRKISAES